MTEKRKETRDPQPASFWRHLSSGELYKVAMVAANPGTGERAVIYARPEAPRQFYFRQITAFQNRFTKEEGLGRADGL